MLMRSVEVVWPSVGSPSVRNRKIFSPFVHGAPNSSLSAVFSIEKPNSKAA